MILCALQIFESSCKPRCWSLSLRHERVRTYMDIWRPIISAVVEALSASHTHSVEKINERLGFVPSEVPCESDFGWTA